jgi:hypothetical protein
MTLITLITLITFIILTSLFTHGQAAERCGAHFARRRYRRCGTAVYCCLRSIHIDFVRVSPVEMRSFVMILYYYFLALVYLDHTMRHAPSADSLDCQWFHPDCQAKGAAETVRAYIQTAKPRVLQRLSELTSRQGCCRECQVVADCQRFRTDCQSFHADCQSFHADCQRLPADCQGLYRLSRCHRDCQGAIETVKVPKRLPEVPCRLSRVSRRLSRLSSYCSDCQVAVATVKLL